MENRLKTAVLVLVVLAGGTLGGALTRTASVAAQGTGGQGGVTIAGPLPLPVSGSVAATQSGTWNVGLTGTPSVAITGTPQVTLAGTPAVHVALPANRFFGRMSLADSLAKATGPLNAQLAVSTVTITNFDGARQQLFLFNAVRGASTCAGSVIGGASPSRSVWVQPYETIQLQFAPAEVYTLGCFGAQVGTLTGGSVEVTVTGFAAS
jgi:hypothetical protein